MGALPPLNQEHWEEAFQKYRETPQFRISNPDMDIQGFKVIFFWEYIHRLWGRLLGFFFAVPLVYFFWKGSLSKPWLIKLVVALILGAAQGFLGWFMVMSGLVDKPWVSPYRLTAHLILALALFAYILWLVLDVFYDKTNNVCEAEGRVPDWLKWAAPFLLGLFGLQITWGGFMAGGKWAMSYPTFPTLNGEWLPPSLWQYRSLWHHLCEHPAAVHLIHRGLGTLLLILVFLFWWKTGRQGWRGLLGRVRMILPLLVLVQFLLGVMTVLFSQGRVPVFLGVVHQGMAVALLAAMVLLCHRVRACQPP
jgi:cytochrome c oxidase assembly protein subunit 15